MLLSPALTQAGSMGISLFPAPRLGGKPSPAGSQTTVKQLLPFDGMQWQGTHRRSQPTSPALLHSSQPPATQLGSRSPRAQPGQPLERGAPRAAAKPQGLGSVVLWGQSQGHRPGVLPGRWDCPALGSGTAQGSPGAVGAGQGCAALAQDGQSQAQELAGGRGSWSWSHTWPTQNVGIQKIPAPRARLRAGTQGHRDTGTEHPDGCTQGAPQSGAAGSAALTLQR